MTMSKDPFFFILIGILVLHVFLPSIVSPAIITYTFIGYVIIMFLRSFRKKDEIEEE